jgi:hypothetical protein
MEDIDQIPNDDEIFVPGPGDEDPDATSQMRQGRGDLDPDNALYDPYFPDAQAAQDWAGTSEFAEPGAGEH